MPTPLARHERRARVVAQSVPHRVVAGSPLELVCSIENRGRVPLVSDMPNPVHVSYRWFRRGRLVDDASPRVPLPHVLRPGGTVTVTVPVASPTKQGTYVLRLTLVQEDVAWFDDEAAENAAIAKIRVREPSWLRQQLIPPYARRFPPPAVPWTLDYLRRRHAFVAASVGDELLLDRFRRRLPLPRGYGIGFDERVVEYPWLFAEQLPEPILDAGSTLNHRHVLEYLGPAARSLTIVTLAPEAESFPALGPTYRYADLRQLPFEDGTFETVVCLSTLEHVGMDNARFGAPGGRAADTNRERDRAVAEIRRVTRRGGRLMISIPYGAADDIGWLRQYTREDVERLHDILAPAEVDVEVFSYSRRGWRRSSLAAARDARFEDYAGTPHVVADRAAAARAVACLRAVV